MKNHMKIKVCTIQKNQKYSSDDLLGETIFLPVTYLKGKKRFEQACISNRQIS